MNWRAKRSLTGRRPGSHEFKAGREIVRQRPSSHCLPLKTPRGTSRKWFSACRCGSRLMPLRCSDSGAYVGAFGRDDREIGGEEGAWQPQRRPPRTAAMSAQAIPSRRRRRNSRASARIGGGVGAILVRSRRSSTSRSPTLRAVEHRGRISGSGRGKAGSRPLLMAEILVIPPRAAILGDRPAAPSRRTRCCSLSLDACALSKNSPK